MKRNIALFSIIFITIAGIAQTNDTINRMVLIESTYNPIITGAVKRNFIPDEVKPSMQKEQVIYANEYLPIKKFNRNIDAIQPISMKKESILPGYVHFGYGNYNNLNGLATYKLNFKQNQSLALKTHLHGWDGYIKNFEGSKWLSSLHDMGLNASYQLLFKQSELEVGGEIVSYAYNYLTHGLANESVDIQNAYKANIYIKIKGIAGEHYTYQLQSHYTNFGRNTLWGNKQNHQEGHLHIEASLSADIYEKGIATLHMRNDLLTYHNIDTYRNYYSLGLTPEWSYKHNEWKILIGTNVDFLTNNGPSIQISPQCHVSYMPANKFSVNFTLNGGRNITTWSHLYAISPYWSSDKQLKNSYTYLNAQIGGNIRFFEGLSMHLGGGYKVVNDALFDSAIDSLGIVYSGIENHNTQIFYAEGNVKYFYKDLLSLSAEATYKKWIVKGDKMILSRAPQFDAYISARMRIIENLYVNTDCRTVIFTTINQYQSPAIINWSLGTHYALNKQLSLFIDAHNLLNHHYQHYAGYPSQGFHIMAGAIFKF